MTLLPKEHGAYGQLTLPVITALSVAGVSAAGLFLTVSAVAGFLAHEPVAVLAGARGPRARRELSGAATRWLALYAVITIAAGTTALLSMDPEARWSVIVPILPAALLAIAMLSGQEQSWYGQVAAASAFAGLAVPLSIAGGTSVTTAVATTVPFALLFAASTLAVRVVILRVRGGGNPRATAATRTAVFAVAAVAVVCLGWLTTSDVLPAAAFIAATPGLMTALVIAAYPPQPTQLRRIGWTLVAVSILTAALLIAAL